MSKAQHCVESVASKSSARPSHGRTSPEPGEKGARRPVDMPWTVVLTRDAELGSSIRQAVDPSRVTVVESADLVEEAASAGRCAILITDEASTPRACAAMGERLRRCEPAMVMIAVGNRGQDNALIGLLSAGVADRLMLKPVTPALSKIVIESAAREYQSRRVRSSSVRQETPSPGRAIGDEANAMTQPVRVGPVFSAALEESPAVADKVAVDAALARPAGADESTVGRSLTWIAAAAAAMVIAGWIWWISTQPAALPRGSLTTPTVHPADRWLAEAEKAIEQSRFVDAINALQGARRGDAPDDRISLLEARLREALERQLAGSPAPTRDVPAELIPRAAEVPADARSPAASDSASARTAAMMPMPPSGPAARQIESDAAQPRPTPTRKSGVESVRKVDAEPVKSAARHEPRELAAVNELVAPLDAQASGEAARVEPVQPPVQHDPPAYSTEVPVAERKIVRMIKPEYPSEARVRGIEGWTDVSFVVSSAGDVVNPRVESSSMKQLFARPALSAVKQWKYEPATAGRSEPEHMRVRVEFRTHD